MAFGTNSRAIPQAVIPAIRVRVHMVVFDAKAEVCPAPLACGEAVNITFSLAAFASACPCLALCGGGKFAAAHGVPA